MASLRPSIVNVLLWCENLTGVQLRYRCDTRLMASVDIQMEDKNEPRLFPLGTKTQFWVEVSTSCFVCVIITKTQLKYQVKMTFYVTYLIK